MAPNTKINLKDKVEDGEMDLSMCDLQEVPIKEIAAYKKVYSLDLSNNHLVNLTKSFPTLTNLTKLDLSKNKLKSLPENFGNLVKLRHLDLYKNELQHLPISFSDLKNLRWLDLKDNPLVPGIKEEAGQCLDSKQCMSCAMNIVAFYSALKVKIQEDRENLEKRQQKDKLANEMAAQKAKQLEKKNKKKEKAKSEGKAPVKAEVVNPGVNKKLSDKKIKRVKKSSGKLKYLFFLSFMFWLVCAVLFALTSVNYPHTRFIEEGVVKYWGICMEKSPPALQEIGNKTGDFIGGVHRELGKIIFDLHLQDNALNYIGKIKEYYNFVLNEKK